MLRQCVELAVRLEETGDLLPLGYKRFSNNSPIQWIVEVDVDGRVDVREADIDDPRPARDRSGKPSESNLKPYLLADQAKYAVGIPEDGDESEAELLSRGFRDLISEAYEATGIEDLSSLVDGLENLDPKDPALDGIEPKEFVTVTTVNGGLMFEREPIREFWASYVQRAFTSDDVGTCSICGSERPILQTLPQKVTLLGETCHISSFNRTAFESHGKKQTLNASICYPCGARAAQALNYLTKNSEHNFRITEDQLAVFWTTTGGIETEDGQSIDLAAQIKASLEGDVDDEETSGASLAEVEEILRVPWTAREPSLLIEDGVFLAVISPNKARLVVREWMTASPDEFKRHLRNFLDVQRIEGPWGEPPTAFGLRQIITPLEAQVIDTESRRVATYAPVEPNLTRALLRTAYTGIPPPVGLEARIVHKLQNPSLWKLPWLTHRAMALLNLARSTRQGPFQGDNMPEGTSERLDPQNTSTAYRCGRLLAVLEDIQGQAQGWNLNTTIVDRNFTAASTAPALTFPRLLQLAETAHIPKIRRDKGDKFVRENLEEVVSAIGSFPTALGTKEQGDFSLGFYHQRAEFRRKRDEYLSQQEETPEADQ